MESQYKNVKPFINVNGNKEVSVAYVRTYEESRRRKLAMQIKICGLTSPTEALWLNEHQVDYAGMVLFFPNSKRNITIERAKEIMGALNPAVKKVAVVVSPDADQVKAIESAGFDYIQIHGKLEKEQLVQIHLPILKAFNVKDIDQYPYYCSCPQVAGYVFDGTEPGSGRTFDWKLISTIPRDGKLLLLAGGLHPGNVGEAIVRVQPDGVDVSSGVEYVGGHGKDPEKVAQFVEAVRAVGEEYTRNW